MSETMKIHVSFRWWVKPLMFVSAHVATTIAVLVGGFEQETVDGIAEAIGGFIAKHGVSVVEVY